MPKNLTGNAATFPTQTAPLAGEPRTAGGLEASLQNAADRTAFLSDRLIYLDPERGGVRRLRQFDSVASMKASTDFPALSFAAIDGIGFYQFDAGSVLVEASPAIITPTSVGTGAGRWIAAWLGSLNVANGIPQLDATGKLPTSRLAAGDVGERIAAGTVRKAMADFQYVYVAGASISSSTAFVDVAGASISVVAKAGDYLKLSLTANIINTMTLQFAALRLMLTRPDTTTAVVDGSSLRAGGPETNGQPTSLTCVAPLSADGTYGLRLQHAALDIGSVESSVITIVGELVRP